MSNPQGSDFARMLLKNNMRLGLCAVSNQSDDHAIGSIFNEYTPIVKCIKTYNDKGFIDDKGVAWQYAVPIKISRLTQMDL